MRDLTLADIELLRTQATESDVALEMDEEAFRAFLALTDQYTSHGYPVELQVRYRFVGHLPPAVTAVGAEEMQNSGATDIRQALANYAVDQLYANAGVAPRQRSVSTVLKSGASVRSVARSLNSSASSRWSPSTAGGKSSMTPWRFPSFHRIRCRG